MKPEVIYSKLMNELEQLDEGLGLDSITKVKKQELRKLEEKMMKTKEESTVLSSANEKLQQERSGLTAVLTEEERYITKSIKAINTTAENAAAKLEAVILEEREQIRKVFEDINTAAGRTITELNQNLRSAIDESVSEVNRLSDRTLEVGKDLGRYNEIIESNKWLKGLQALVKGDKEVEPDQVRVIGITVMEASLSWVKHYYQDKTAPLMLRPMISNLVDELEKWKP